jgi:sulfoxide reductase catalytic subunit YedY
VSTAARPDFDAALEETRRLAARAGNEGRGWSIPPDGRNASRQTRPWPKGPKVSLIRIRRPSEPPSREITPEAVYLRRRDFLRAAAAGAGALASALLLPGCGNAQDGAERSAPAVPPSAGPRVPPYAGADALAVTGRRDLAPGEDLTPFDDVTGYNNFYEFGTDKTDPAENAHSLRPRPWSVAIEGEVAKPGVVDLDTLLRPFSLEERIYRHRCVEAWSMVIPWIGFSLGDLLKRHEPTSRAKYVELVTLLDPQQMPGQRRAVLDWPYREGLRIDEAMHPLALLAVGLYGRVLPNQNGAPLRLVVPWKYGFKSVKSIVKIRLRADPPRTTWNEEAPDEYGFYANVNPAVDHPRWSQKRERRIGEWSRRPTLPFNGYAEEVASLYTGMDLEKDF